MTLADTIGSLDDGVQDPFGQDVCSDLRKIKFHTENCDEKRGIKEALCQTRHNDHSKKGRSWNAFSYCGIEEQFFNTKVLGRQPILSFLSVLTDAWYFHIL